MPANPDFDALVTTTLEKRRTKLTDNVFSETVLLNELKRSGKIRMEDGGTQIVEPLMTAGNGTVKPYSGWDLLDITPQEGLSAAVFPWKQVAGSVAINGLEEAVNSGRSAVINLLKAKMTQLEGSYAEALTEMAFGDGTTFGGVANTKGFAGLGALVGTGTVGGINPATAGNEFWQSVMIDANADAAPLRSDKDWAKAYYTASRGADRPDFIVTTQDLYQAYEESLVAQLRFTDNKRADSRFQSLAFKGGLVHFDVFCPEGVTYFLNTKYVGLVGHSKNWMKNKGFREVPDVDGRWALVLSYGNMTISNRARQAKVYNQTVPA